MPVAGSAVLWVRASEPEEGGGLLLRSCRARWLRPGLQARAVWSWVSQGVEKGRPKLTWALIGTPVSHSWRMEEQKYISFQVMLANCHTTCRWVSQPCCASVWLNILQHTHTHTHPSAFHVAVYTLWKHCFQAHQNAEEQNTGCWDRPVT